MMMQQQQQQQHLQETPSKRARLNVEPPLHALLACRDVWNLLREQYLPDEALFLLRRCCRRLRDAVPRDSIGTCSRTLYAYAAQYDSITLLEWLWYTARIPPPYGTDEQDHVAGVATYHGATRAFDWLWERNLYAGTHALCEALRAGRIDLARLVHRKYTTVKFTVTTWQRAAESGSTRVLDWLARRQPNATASYRIWTKAAKHGHIAVLEWARRLDVPQMRLDLRKTNNAAIAAAWYGQLDVLRWLVAENGEDLPGNFAKQHALCAAAAHSGRIEVLQWLRDSIRCAWDHTVCKEALEATPPRFALLRWALENDAPIQTRHRAMLCEHAIEHGATDVLDWAARRSDFLQYCRSARLCVAAARSSQALAMLQILHAHAMPFCAEVCVAAAKHNRLDALQYAQKCGAPWGTDTQVCNAAAGGGHLTLLQWAIDHGALYDASTCFRAASCGRLPTLQLLRSVGCSWDARTSEAAARFRHYALLRWAVEQRVPLNTATVMHLFKWLDECAEEAAKAAAAAATSTTTYPTASTVTARDSVSYAEIQALTVCVSQRLLAEPATNIATAPLIEDSESNCASSTSTSANESDAEEGEESSSSSSASSNHNDASSA